MLKYFGLFIIEAGLLLSGCGPGKSYYVAQNFWNYAPPSYQNTHDFHLTLFWKEVQNKIHPIQLAHPEWFIQRLGQETSIDGIGKLRSYQIVSSPVDLYPWIPFWTPEVPTVRADCNFSIFVSTSEWKIDFSARTNFQPYPVKASWGEPVTATVKRSLSSRDVQNIEALVQWIKEAEPQLYRKVVEQLIKNSKLFEKWNTYVFFYPGKNPGMLEAFELAKKKDWQAAKNRWLRELEISKNNPVIYLNLSSASQMLEQWDEALDYLEKYRLNKPQGFVWLFSGLPIENETLELLKGLSLYNKYKSKRNRFRPRSKLAILLLNNLTNNLSIPDTVRSKLLIESKYWGHDTVSLEEVNQKLFQNGFTDGGQLGATTPQALGKMVGADLLIMGDVEGYSHGTYSLVHAETGEIIFKKRVSGLYQTYSESYKVKTDIDAQKEYNRKKLEESNRLRKVTSEVPGGQETAARSFFLTWPRNFSK